jgi:PPP family 3-phenylpropionic acid transporter
MGRPRRASPLSAVELQHDGPRLMNRFFVMMVTGAGVINASHAYMNTFGSIYWKSVGLADTTIGVLWAWAVVAEVGIFLIFTRLFSRFSAQTILGLAGAGAMLRWVVFPLVWPLGLGVTGFFAAQSLHSLSTALVLIGVQKLIAETVPEERTGAAQGVAFFANGLSFAAATLLSGPLYEKLGVHGFYVMVGIAAAGFAIVALAPRSAPELGLRR